MKRVRYGADATNPEALIAVFEGLQGMLQKMGKKDQGSETHPPLHARIKRLSMLLIS
jgi:Zn-dependent protease with chaperone function